MTPRSFKRRKAIRFCNLGPLALGTALAVMPTGCARVDVHQLSETERANWVNEKSNGVRYYRPWPYLLVTAEPPKDAAKDPTTFKSEIIWLPKMDEEYVVNVIPGWGTVDGSVKLANGWMLTDLGAKSDSKIPETLTAVTGLIKEASAAAQTPAGYIPPGLYRLKFKNGYVSGVELVGLTPEPAAKP